MAPAEDCLICLFSIYLPLSPLSMYDMHSHISKKKFGQIFALKIGWLTYAAIKTSLPVDKLCTL